MLWASQALEDNGPTAPVYDDERVIFNTESCTLFVIDARTGKKLWFKYLGDPTLSQPAVAEGLVYASHPSPVGQALTAFRIKDGARVWTRRIDAELLAAPVAFGGAVYREASPRAASAPRERLPSWTPTPTYRTCAGSAMSRRLLRPS